MATKKVNKKSFEKTIDGVKETFKEMHNGVYELSDDMIDLSIGAGEKWQKIFVKVINGSADLFAKQQDYMFSSLEEVKDQFKDGKKRFKKLISIREPVAKKSVPKKVSKAVKA